MAIVQYPLDNMPKRLRYAMHRRGMDAHQLADKADVSVDIIRKTAKGAYRPSVDASCAIADALGISLDWWTGRVG